MSPPGCVNNFLYFSIIAYTIIERNPKLLEIITLFDQEEFTRDKNYFR